MEHKKQENLCLSEEGKDITVGQIVEIWENTQTCDGKLTHGIALKFVKEEPPFILDDEPEEKQKVYVLQHWIVYNIEEQKEKYVKLRLLKTTGLKTSKPSDDEKAIKLMLNDTFIIFNGVEVF